MAIFDRLTTQFRKYLGMSNKFNFTHVERLNITCTYASSIGKLYHRIHASSAHCSHLGAILLSTLHIQA